ncbi:Tudor domain-containing protein 6 [Orchesella cincta]|uniref:Tudor domain-containing protein 6 n=1 Tax=Orchesella cincta TaxID=48709 RepID=A0A1D2MXE3_ORCCI|nr:Tudor domain-containing protein 6 [Orchesella cincta]
MKRFEMNLQPKKGPQMQPPDMGLLHMALGHGDPTPEVLPYREWPSKRIMPYRVKRVVSPFEIYLEYALNSAVDKYNEWFPEMQQFYNNPNLGREYMLSNGVAIIGKSYACRDYNDNKWYRVRCHDTDGKSATVFYCDFGNLQMVNPSVLRELDLKFSAWSSQAFRAHLADVLPLDGGMTWSQEVCEIFSNMVMGRVFKGIVVYREDRVINSNFPDFTANMGIVLFDKFIRHQNKKKIHEGPFCTINAMLVDMGKAQVTGACATCHHTISPSDYGYSDFEHDLWNVGIDDEDDPSPPSPDADSDNLVEEDFDLGILTQNQLRAISSNPANVKPPKMTWKHHNQLDRVDVDLSDVVARTAAEMLPLEIRDRLCHVTLSFVLGPNHIYVNFVSRQKALSKMQKDIQTLVANVTSLPQEELQIGKFVACRTHGIWCRCVVKAYYDHSQRVKLLFVDHGNETMVDASAVKNLPEIFHTIPSFAFRVHLDAPGLKPVGQLGWSADACEDFRKYTYTWHRTTAVYYLFRPVHSEKIELAEYTQELSFDENKWIPGSKKDIDHNKPINKLKEHPMLRPLFCSFGVEIDYEVFMNDSPLWHFRPIYDDLLHNEHALLEINRNAINTNSNIVNFIATKAEKVKKVSKPVLSRFPNAPPKHTQRVGI